MSASPGIPDIPGIAGIAGILGVTWVTPGFMSASLDHAVWIHDDVNVNDWLLYHCDSPWAGRGRGFNRGSIYTRDGRLVATCAQEGLIRRPKSA